LFGSDVDDDYDSSRVDIDITEENLWSNWEQKNYKDVVEFFNMIKNGEVELYQKSTWKRGANYWDIK